MLYTTIQNTDPLHQAVIDRFCNNRLLQVLATGYEELTGKDIGEICLNEKRADHMLKSVLPNNYKKKKAYSAYMSVFHSLLANIPMTADPLSSFIINVILVSYPQAKVPLTDSEMEQLEKYVRWLGKQAGYCDEKIEEYQKDIPKILEEIHEMPLREVFGFGYFDMHWYDALSRRELKQIERGFEREFTPVADLIEEIRGECVCEEEA